VVLSIVNYTASSGCTNEDGQSACPSEVLRLPSKDSLEEGKRFCLIKDFSFLEFQFWAFSDSGEPFLGPAPPSPLSLQ